MTGELKTLSLSILQDVERGNAPTTGELVSKICEFALVGEDLRKFALVCQAIHFVSRFSRKIHLEPQSGIETICRKKPKI